MQSRSYLNMPHGLHASPHNSGAATPHHIQETNSLASDEMGVIYGTNISTRHVIGALEHFILNFEVTRPADGGILTERVYRNQLNELELLERHIFEVQGRHLKEHDR